MIATIDEVYTLELEDLGDATVETKQIWFGQLPDNQFGLGFFRG